ncbi:heme A synthase [Photobacterium aphoticum]|nr:heme A synthase [Photobacterium aphoticum]
MAKVQSIAKAGTLKAGTHQRVWQDYLTMTKPKVVAMLLLTALVGMCLAVPGIPPVKAVVLG